MGSKTAIYCRISTTGQNLDGQKASLQRWVDSSGLAEGSVEWFTDRGKSGETLDRPAFKQMQAGIVRGEIKTVCCFRLDRIARSMSDGIALLKDWTDKGIRVVSLCEAFDLSGTVGQIVASVLLGVAQLETQARKERQAVGIASAREQGKYPGKRAGSFSRKVLEKRAAFARLRSTGASVREIATATGCSTQTVIRHLREMDATAAK